MRPAFRSSLFANVAGAVGLAVLVDGAIALLGWGSASDARALAGAPPGIVVGAVWVVLFGLMGAARATVTDSMHPQRRALARGIVGVLVFCSLYPAYTGGLSSLRAAELGNITTLAVASVLALALRPASPRAAALVVPTIAWVGFATALTTNALVGNR